MPPDEDGTRHQHCDYRLSSAYEWRQQIQQCVQAAGNIRYFPRSESSGKGAECAGSSSFPAQPCSGAETGSPAHAVGSKGFRGY